MSDTPEELEQGDAGVPLQAQPDGAVNGAEFPVDATMQVMPDTPPQQPLGLTDTVLAQLPLHEQLGFLRGNIMMLAARIGTGEADPRDGERLNEMNFLFQLRLRAMLQHNEEQQARVQADMDRTQRMADEDARARGFADSNDMGLKMKELYESICERVKQWHASTEPGGDPLMAPETDALLYDVYLVTEGKAR